MEPVDEIRVIHDARLVCLRSVLVCKKDLIAPNLHLTDLILLSHGHEGAVVYFLDFLFCNHRNDHGVPQEQDQENCYIEDKQRFPWSVNLVHSYSFLS